MADFTYDEGKPDSVVVQFTDDTVTFDVGPTRTLTITLAQARAISKAYRAAKKNGAV